MNGRTLTFGLVGALALGAAFRARGSSNGAAPSPLQKRLLHLLQQYPEPNASYAILFAATLPGVRLGRQSLRTEWEETDYLSKPYGRVRFEDDLRENGVDAKAWAKDTVEQGVWYDGSTLAARSGWEPLLPWIGKEVNRIVKTLPPIQKVPASSVTRKARGFLTLDLDAIRRLHEYLTDMDLEETEGEKQGQLHRSQRQARRFESNRLADIFGPESQVVQNKRESVLLYRNPYGMFAKWDGPMGSPEQILIHLHLERLHKLLPEIRDWFSSGTAGDIGKLTYEDAAKKAKAWHRQIEQAAGAAKGAKKATTEGAVVARLTGGWTVQELAEQDLRPQSDAMGHCVGRSDTYRAMIRDGKGKIFSVRDGAGRSIFTLEARADGLDGSLRVMQFKGAGNRIPGLTAPKTKLVPIGGSEAVKGWIERAKKPFVSMPDVERASEVVRALSAMFPKTNDSFAPVVTFPTSDLDVVRAMGKMP